MRRRRSGSARAVRRGVSRVSASSSDFEDLGLQSHSVAKVGNHHHGHVELAADQKVFEIVAIILDRGDFDSWKTTTVSGEQIGQNVAGDKRGHAENDEKTLEQAAKEMDMAIVISDTAAKLSGVDLSAFETCRIDIRGRAEPLPVRAIPHGATIALAEAAHADAAE